jgi:hypothetical protein
MSSGVIRFGLAVAAVAALTIPSWASGHRDSTPWTVTQTATIGSTSVEPGDYQIHAQEQGNQLEVVKGTQVVATVPCHWVHLNQKASQSEILMTSNNVQEIEFSGRTEAVKIDSRMHSQGQ